MCNFLYCLVEVTFNSDLVSSFGHDVRLFFSFRRLTHAYSGYFTYGIRFSGSIQFLLASFFKHLQTLLAKGRSVFHQVDHVLHLEENLKGVEPHNLVASGVG